MTGVHADSAEQAYAVALLQHLASMCDETRRTSASDPARVEMMLAAFEETLAKLAPVLERLGQSAGVSYDAVLAAAQHATSCHQGLMDAMGLELERIGHAIAAGDHATTASLAYTGSTAPSARHGFEARG